MSDFRRGSARFDHDGSASSRSEGGARGFRALVRTGQDGLGTAFLGEVARAAAAIEEAPATWSVVEKTRGIRRFVLTRFPYVPLCRIDPNAVILLAVARTGRRPGYWRGRRVP